MKIIKNIIKLTRLDNPIPILGVFLPCLFGMAWGQYYMKYQDFIKNIIFFAFASILTRSLGDVINDIVDKDIDKYVRRTKTRVLATEELPLWIAYLVAFVLAIIGFYMLFWLKPLAVFFALCGALLMLVYPFTKRFLKMPQLVLGFAYNIGLLVTYANITNSISFSVLCIYVACIYWTMSYDTIYAYQDLEDDLKLNINSTAVLYQKDPKYYIKSLLSMILWLMLLAALTDELHINWFYYVSIFFCVGYMARIVSKLDLKDETECKNAFRINIALGFVFIFSFYFGR